MRVAICQESGTVIDGCFGPIELRQSLEGGDPHSCDVIAQCGA
jgi:hypothetical protein